MTSAGAFCVESVARYVVGMCNALKWRQPVVENEEIIRNYLDLRIISPNNKYSYDQVKHRTHTEMFYKLKFFYCLFNLITI